MCVWLCIIMVDHAHHCWHGHLVACQRAGPGASSKRHWERRKSLQGCQRFSYSTYTCSDCSGENRFKKKRETNTATTYAITADVQWNPRIKLHMHFSALQWFVSPGDQSVGISLWDSPIFMWKFSATPESENWFTGKFTRNRACSPSNPLIQHDPTIHTVPEVCRTAAGTNVHLEPVLSACRPVAESAEAASSSRCFFKNMELQMFKVAPPAT